MYHSKINITNTKMIGESTLYNMKTAYCIPRPSPSPLETDDKSALRSLSLVGNT